MAKVPAESPSKSKYARLFNPEMLYEGDGDEYDEYKVTEEDRENEEKKMLEFARKFGNEEDIGSDSSKIADYFAYEDEEDFDEVKDPRQTAAVNNVLDPLERQHATAAAVNNVLEEIIQLPASKKICYAHHIDQEILTKVLENLKNSIAQETLIQLAKHAQQMQAHEQQDSKGKLIPTFGRCIPDSADAVNNVSEEMTRLPASKKIRYAHDDEEIPSKISEEFDYS